LLNLLGRSKLADRIVQANLSPQILVDDLRKLAIVVTPTNVPRVVPTDPDDDHVLAAALAGAADLIASGDRRDLLPLGNYAGIPIVSAREAMERIAPR
jgi:predicted nucleic acid-binding protein